MCKKVVIYGPEGIGKSTFASQFPEPVFIDTEGSTNSMDVARLPKPTSWQMELLMMKNTEAGLGNDTIFDYQTGYPRPQSVVGFDQKKYDRREKVLERKKEKVKAMDQWIDDIKDGQTRYVFRMFYKQGMTWKAIAKQIGMPHNEDYPRPMIRDKYLKNQGIK